MKLGSAAPLTSLLALALAANGALAQTLEGVVAEGPISAITADSITVMGIVVRVPSGKARTPTNPDVALSDLNAALPGRPQGFRDGTAIVEGTSTAGVVEAVDVFSDVTENVLVGEATDADADPATLHVNGLLVRASTDPRMPAGPATNEAGFAVKPETIRPATLVAVEGYYSPDDDALYYHTLEADAADLVRPDQHEVSVTRAQCDDGGDEIEVRGAVHMPIPPTGEPPVAVGRVQIVLAPSGTPVSGGLAPVSPDADAPGFGAYRFRERGLSLAACPGRIEARFLPETSEEPLAVVEADVEAR